MGIPQYNPASAQDQPQPAPAPSRPAPVVLPPELIAGTLLDQLLNRLEAAKARVTEAEQDRDAIIAEIKAQGVAQAMSANGGKIPEDIRFPGTPARPGWQLRWTVTRKFNSKRFAAEQPVIYEAYREPKGGWVLGPQD